jgi:hypothetical protein
LCPALLLGCILVLLFPVISVTDDLHAMRPEMEESSPSRRAIRQSAGDRSQSGSSGLGTFPSDIVCLFSFLPSNEACEHILTKPVRLPEEAQLATCSSRAPPCPNLANNMGRRHSVAESKLPSFAVLSVADALRGDEKLLGVPDAKDALEVFGTCPSPWFRPGSRSARALDMAEGARTL